MALKVERISAVTFRVSNMNASVQFYRDVLGMEVLYGAEELRGSLPCVRKTRTLPSSIWSRVSGSTAGVGLSSMWRMWTRSGDASTSWDSSPKSRRMLRGGERYFHMLDPDGHELSFACPLRPTV